MNHAVAVDATCPPIPLMPCSPLPNRHCRQHLALDGLERQSVCTPGPAGHPIDHHVAERPRRSCTEISLGARGHGHGHYPIATGR